MFMNNTVIRKRVIQTVMTDLIRLCLSYAELDKMEYLMIIFLISHRNHML